LDREKVVLARSDSGMLPEEPASWSCKLKRCEV